MESLTKVRCAHPPLQLSLAYHRPLFPKPFSSLSFRTRSKSSSIKLSSSSSQVPQNSLNPKPSLPQSFNPFSLIKATCTTIAAATLFFSRFSYVAAIAAPVATPTVETSEETSSADVVSSLSTDKMEKTIQDHLSQNPNDVESLKSLMELRIKSGRLLEAIEVIDRLIEIEPEEEEWPLFKAHIHSYAGNIELSKNAFEEILAKDPLRVEAYHGLLMTTSESGGDLKEIVKRVEGAMEKCKKQRLYSEVRDFKLLIAQIWVIEGKYNDALKVYQGLVKDDPKDFRPYLCQGIIYTLLEKKDEAERQFEKYRKLVPKNHPYAEYFDDNMFATKLFAQKMEREKTGSKS